MRLGTVRSLRNIVIVAVAAALLGGCMAVGKNCRFDSDCGNGRCGGGGGGGMRGNCVHW